MFVAFCRFVFRLRGWKASGLIPTPDAAKRCVMVAAPHTTNWDAIYTIACFDIMGIKWRFTIKKEWLKPPFGGILKSLGAIGIDRSPRKAGEQRPSTVEAMARLFEEHEQLCIVVTPEGTRSLAKEWKTGFYHVAKRAGVPIALGYMDYAKKEAGVGKIIYPSDDMAADMRQIMDFYKTITPKFPEKFSLDVRYQ
jgi:1-acyl-sn-glycerol-3-phosphate acyltransferase